VYFNSEHCKKRNVKSNLRCSTTKKLFHSLVEYYKIRLCYAQPRPLDFIALYICKYNCISSQHKKADITFLPVPIFPGSIYFHAISEYFFGTSEYVFVDFSIDHIFSWIKKCTAVITFYNTD